MHVVGLIVGFALQAMGGMGEPVLNFIALLQRLVFKILGGIMWLAPIGAFGAIAGVVGNTGWSAIASLGMLVGVFYATCAVSWSSSWARSSRQPPGTRSSN